MERKYAAEIELLNADDDDLLALSRGNLLSLDLPEMKAIRDYFKKAGRDPTDCEIETIAQTWSEHCYHKTFKAGIAYTERFGNRVTEERLVLMEEIMGVTRKLNKDLCVSVFKDNAGIIRFNRQTGVAFKVETHNHPSMLEPYGGAGTGTGGVIRDILGAGKGAKPILNTDVFCLGMPDASYDQLPEGVLHPRRVFRGVVSGVRDYGNRMGIPTGNGAIIFDEGYQNNCLVFCGTVGLIPLSEVEKEVAVDDYIVLAGGKTGIDGIHGATFSSAGTHKDTPATVVQIGNPIVQKRLADVLLAARDLQLYNAITDCGAGGLSSAVGELGGDTGAVVHLDKVPLKCEQATSWQIWISESQERMVFSVPGNKIDALMALFEAEDVEAAVIGQFNKTGKLTLYYKDELVGELEMAFLHNGIPAKRLEAFFAVSKRAVPASRGPFAGIGSRDLKRSVLNLLKEPNIASKEAVIRQYDYEVQSRTVLKPIVGMEHQGPSDAAVLKPLYDNWRGIAVACGINPCYGEEDPYLMAGCCIEEALRNVVAVGGNPDQTAILDNFCWGDIGDKYQLGRLVRCVKGCKEFALAYKLPFISGKDSLNNFFVCQQGNREETASIPGTLLISAVSLTGDIRRITSSDLKKTGNLVYACGQTRVELGGSRYYKMLGRAGGEVPAPTPVVTLPMMRKLHAVISGGLVASAHDCSDGGFIVTVSEMLIGGGKGADIYLDRLAPQEISPEELLFSESQGRFVVEVAPERQRAFEDTMDADDINLVGVVRADGLLRVFHRDTLLFVLPYRELAGTWRSGVRW